MKFRRTVGFLVLSYTSSIQMLTTLANPGELHNKQSQKAENPGF